MQCWTSLQVLSTLNRVSLSWVPGHCDIAGNERADKPTRKGSAAILCVPEPDLPFSGSNAQLMTKNWADNIHLNNWESVTNCRHSKLWLVRPNLQNQNNRSLSGSLRQPTLFSMRTRGGDSFSLDANLQYASSIWSPHQACHSDRIERIQHYFVRFALRRMQWTANPLHAYDSRCALLGLESVADRRRVSSALLIRDLLCGRVDSPLLTSKLHFEQRPYASRRHA
jgi:hypothetical protein